ncbi:hypothetical protein [Variovorax sp. LjRoot178]
MADVRVQRDGRASGARYERTAGHPSCFMQVSELTRRVHSDAA